jgi:hypothetical protein
VSAGGLPFKTRQKIGQWGEDTFCEYFRKHTEAGVRVLKYGEASHETAKASGDAVIRPDLLLIDQHDIDRLILDDVLTSTTDLRLLPDSDPAVQAAVAAAWVAVEVKFSHREYRPRTINFIFDNRRRDAYLKWKARTPHLEDVVVWFTTNRVFMARMDRILSQGRDQSRPYESWGKGVRVKETRDLPVESGTFFANVVGYRVNETLRPSLKLNPRSGAINFDVEDDLGDLSDVDLDALRRIAKEA